MCGFLATNKPANKDVMGRAIRHRGTRKPLFDHRADFTFCHALMPVQGVGAVPQPYSENSDALLLYQGELWHHPGEASDTRYLFTQLDTDGPRAALPRLNGMFSFVWWDGRYLWFGCDPFGEQPIYYYHHGGGGFFNTLSVASEIKGLRAVGHPFATIRSALPGTLYRFSSDTGELTEERYHRFDFNKPRTDEFDHDELRGMVAAACYEKFHANSLQKSALLLSGGVDSAIIAYELSKLGVTRAFTVGTEKDSVDAINARAVAGRYGLHLTEVVCKTFDIDTSLAVTEMRNRSMAEEYVCHLALARCLADSGYRVVFSGAGADELFMGYSYYLRFIGKHQRAELQQRFIENYHKMDLRIMNKVFMAAAVEVRSPFLSTALADYALTLDPNALLVGPKNQMKFALREAYSDIIPSARNPKLIAVETMGVKELYARRHGTTNPRIYYKRFGEIFEDNELLFRLVDQAGKAEYEVVAD